MTQITKGEKKLIPNLFIYVSLSEKRHANIKATFYRKRKETLEKAF